MKNINGLTQQPAPVAAYEVVYQASYKDGFWQDCSRERYEYLKALKIGSSVDWTLRILYTAPQPTQAVPPAGREPLTELQRQAIYDEHCYLGDSGWEVNWSDVIDAVEAAHGIKGKE